MLENFCERLDRINLKNTSTNFADSDTRVYKYNVHIERDNVYYGKKLVGKLVGSELKFTTKLATPLMNHIKQKVSEISSKLVSRHAKYVFSDEHKESFDKETHKDCYYGYVNINHPTLGNFEVSYNINTFKLQLDQYPWKRLKKLTTEQLEFVKKHKSYIEKLAKENRYGK